ncbi:Cu-Zn family superoxide dismutase [Scopulibacillus darangshiensis]|uniref:Cu-Zn family superoxide dismutase n=1 Tax=Scopulibacillus darangshiensis TaxID=442528 RepID=A0A4R2P765_9BACL|nr:superoxide dismutase family protein [Scopulibacillus darangshiensis]TCP29831.1 Cu-Zn family superoxide dismutase [Scopulibacillus darangshiensis]
MRNKWIYIVCGIMVIAAVVFLSNRHLSVKANESPSKMSQNVVVMLKNSKGQTVGQASLAETEKGVRIYLHAEGLKPGLHGIHFHEKGVCQLPDFKSAGGHFNPFGKEHGLENPKGPHAGDMENIFVDSKGKVNTSFVNPRVTLVKGERNSLRDQNGSALIIHEGADDQKTNPSGDSGSRVICGVIK